MNQFWISEGDRISGVIVEEIIVERYWYCEETPLNIEKFFFSPVERMLEDPCFYVAVFKCNDQSYLFLDANLDSATFNYMYDEGQLPNLGLTALNEEEMKYFSQQLKTLGNNDVDDVPRAFSNFLGALCAIIPCNIGFEIMFEKGGYFRPKDNQIKVASNQSFLDVLFCLLHEYAHYLQKDEKISVPKTVGEYVFDAEECTCNYVAYSVLCRYFKEHEDSINKIVKKYCVPGASCDAEYAYELVNQIITHLEDKLQSCDFEDVLFVPRGLIYLSTEDNAALYRLIMEEISPIIPEEAEEEWSI